MSRAPCTGYHSNDSRAVAHASSRDGAHTVIVKVAASSCTYLPIGVVHDCTGGRQMSIFFSTPSGGTPTANEHNPRPSAPICRCPSSLDVAPHNGGCGCCS